MSVTVPSIRAAIALLSLGIAGVAGAPGVSQPVVSGVVSVLRKSKAPADNSEIAVWLKPVGGAAPRSSELPPPRLRPHIAQHNKRFEPRVLVVPVGSIVEFPNLDPFFHNVFSLFDGKRFDLGLYEAGSSRSVPFNTVGVCYIFCNIHPEMSAVVVVVDTPYYAITNRAGEFSLSNVPPGRYALSVWHERDKPEHPHDFPREVTISGASNALAPIHLVESDEVIAPHKNKYGHDYVPPKAAYKGGG